MARGRDYVLVFGIIVTAAISPAMAQSPKPSEVPRFWLAGRYDGSHVIVLFDEVKFKGTIPRDAHFLPVPTTPGFLFQQELPESYANRVPLDPNAERFHIGDQYDLLLGDGRIETVTLSTVVACVSDDEDDDPSYLGALAKVTDASALLGEQEYYALRRHENGASLATPSGTFASLSEVPPRFDTETKIAALLTEKMRITAKASALSQAEKLAPILAVQEFRLADGNLRYYARAEWRATTSPGGPPVFALGAWIAPAPTLHILATEEITSPYGFAYELPNLRNVVDLGDGCTGIIADFTGPGEGTLGLWEYRDGANLHQMHNFQRIEMDE
jgi:hypothetical protein